MSEMTKEQLQDELNSLVEKIFLNENKQYLASQLASNFVIRADANRYDTTIQNVSRVVSQIAKNDPNKSITASEILQLGDKFHTAGTKFKEVFADVLPELSAVQTSTSTKRDELVESFREINEITNKQDSDLIEGSIDYLSTDLPKIRYAALLACEEFKNASGKKYNFKLKYATPELYMFETHTNTAMGDKPIYVPVELVDETPIIPTSFVSTENVYSLDNEGFNQFQQNIAIAQQKKTLTAINNLRADLGYTDAVRTSDDVNTIEVDEYEDTPKQVKLECKEVEDLLKQAVLHKETRYSSKTIENGEKIVRAKLKELQVKVSSVKFAGDTTDGFKFDSVVSNSEGNISVEVPLEVENDRFILEPEVVVANNNKYNCSKQGFIELFASNQPKQDVNPFLFNMSYNELKKQLKNAAYNRKPETAKQIIAIIGEKFDSYYTTAALDDYQYWLEEQVPMQQVELSDEEKESVSVDSGMNLTF